MYGKGNRYKVILVDCGVKHSIIRCLVERDVEVHLVPWNYDYSKEDYDGLFVTNGPGDPLLAPETMQILRKVSLGLTGLKMYSRISFWNLNPIDFFLDLANL